MISNKNLVKHQPVVIPDIKIEMYAFFLFIIFTIILSQFTHNFKSENSFLYLSV